MEKIGMYAKPHERMGSFIQMIPEGASIQLLVRRDGEDVEEFVGTTQEFHSYAKLCYQNCKVDPRNDIVLEIWHHPDGWIIITEEPEEKAPRTRLDEVGELTLLPPAILQLIRVRELMLVTAKKTQIELVTETRQGSNWEVLFRGSVEDFFTQVQQFRNWLELPIKNVQIVDGYLSIHVVDRRLT